MTNKELLEMCEEVQTLVDQLNILDHSDIQDHRSIDDRLEQLQIIGSSLRGDIVAQSHFNRSQKHFIQ